MKNFLAPFLLIILISNAANAEGKPHSWKGSGNCYRDTYYEYGFICGTSIADDTECGGKKAKRLKKKYFYDNGECFSIDHADGTTGENISYFCCCSGTWKAISTDKNGRYNSGTLGGFKLSNYTEQVWYIKTTATETISGGTCTYEKKVNMCGTQINKACTTPTSCSDGLVLRNGVCTSRCPDGQAWETDSINKCVACETTYYQGITNNSTSTNGKNIAAQGFDNKICTKCDKDTEFFDKKDKECIKKTTLKQIPNNTMKKCGLCTTDDVMKQCISYYSGQTSACDEQCKKDCMITE